MSLGYYPIGQRRHPPRRWHHDDLRSRRCISCRRRYWPRPQGDTARLGPSLCQPWI